MVVEKGKSHACTAWGAIFGTLLSLLHDYFSHTIEDNEYSMNAESTKYKKILIIV